MRLPRRVPWSSIAELEQVCSWIFTDESDLGSKVSAINRLSAWRAITTLPHALESTLFLLVVILQDSQNQTQTFHLSLRQSYSTAIIRLVNGLVDPLQLGAYARSIASIANQLGLPAWLVELRHSATHEDLPSIELLRGAARESMIWLLHNYFLPTINPSSVSEAQATPLRPFTPILKQYKTLLKITARDASLKSQYKPKVLAVMRDIERWIAEVKVATNVAVGEVGWDTEGPEDVPGGGEQDLKEKYALERVCDALLEKGALVPLSKRKRDFPPDSFSPPNFSVLLWSPLLKHLESLHPDFPSVLISRISSRLLMEVGPGKAPSEIQLDLSYDMCLARWAMWTIERWEGGGARNDLDLRKEVTSNLMHGLALIPDAVDRKAAIALLESICAGNQELETMLSALLKFSSSRSSSSWTSNDITIMEERLSALLSLNASVGQTSRPSLTSTSTSRMSTPAEGWRLLDESTGWNPCPIGVHYKF